MAQAAKATARSANSAPRTAGRSRLRPAYAALAAGLGGGFSGLSCFFDHEM